MHPTWGAHEMMQKLVGLYALKQANATERGDNYLDARRSAKQKISLSGHSRQQAAGNCSKDDGPLSGRRIIVVLFRLGIAALIYISVLAFRA